MGKKSKVKDAINLQTAFSDDKREVIFDDQATKIAMKLLSTEGFKVWMCLGVLEDDNDYVLDNEEIMKFCNVTEEELESFYDELIDYGYLMLTDGEGEHWSFSDMPR